MAKYEVKFSCGHIHTVELFGKSTDRHNRIAWLENCGLCPDCYAEQQNAENANGCEEVTMKYSEYKTNYANCETKRGSYNADDKTIVVYVPVAKADVETEVVVETDVEKEAIDSIYECLQENFKDKIIPETEFRQKAKDYLYMTDQQLEFMKSKCTLKPDIRICEIIENFKKRKEIQIVEDYKFRIDEIADDGVVTRFTHLNESVTDIVIPSTVNGKKVTAIGDSLFSGCEYITSVTIPEGVTSIGDMAFQSCSGLTSITLPSTITTIKKGAFSWCKSLTSVTIPSTVTIIGYGAFGECSNLSDVYYNGTQEQWNKICIDNFNNPLQNATKHFVE